MTITYTLGGSLYVNLTNRCPNACEFCVRTLHDGLGSADNLWLEHEPTVEEVLLDLEKRDLDDYDQLVFCGYGEPFCRLDDLLAVSRAVRKRSQIEQRINTNGLGDLICGRDTARELSGLIDCVSISLNAPTPEWYDEICHSEYGLKALPAILRFAKRAKEHVPRVTFTVVSTLGQKGIEQCKILAKQCGVPLRVREMIE